MGKPSNEELETAINEASRMREQGEDPHFIAKALLNFNYRIRHLENLAHAAERYIHSGQAISEHQNLIRAIDTYRNIDQRTEGKEDTNFAL